MNSLPPNALAVLAEWSDDFEAVFQGDDSFLLATGLFVGGLVMAVREVDAAAT